MHISTFYAVTSAACFKLVDLGWSVVKDKAEWLKDEAKKRMAGGVFASFLISVVMSLATQLGVDSPLVWRGVFAIAAAAGLIYSSRLIQSAWQANPKGAVSRNSWAVPAFYGLILFFAIFSDLAGYAGLIPLQLEGLLLSGVILCGNNLAWEFMTS